MKNLTLFLFAMLLTFNLVAQETILHCGSIFTKDGNLQNRKSIVLDKDRIVSVEDGFVTKPNAKIIDLKNKTVLPGLTDMHVHLEGETSKNQIAKRMSMNPADIAYEAQNHAKTTLMAGFTAVRDLGGSGVNISLRNAINQGLVDGPRIFTSGKTIATTGGHGDPTNGWRNDISFPTDMSDGVVDSYDEAKKAVRQRYQDGVDCIKITATGGVLSIAKNGKGPQFKMDELAGIIETAKDYGFHVAAHAHGAEGMKRALRAGVTTIEHGSLMDEEAMSLFVEKGAYLVPTIIAGKTVSDSAKVKGYYHPLVVPKAIEIGDQIQGTFAKAYKGGVKIAFGTDAGVFIHGNNAKEFQYMHEAGMPMKEALLSATVTPAKILKMEDDMGSLDAGKYADIIAVEGNPLLDPKVLMKVDFVMKGGVVYKGN
ncbi:Imidazolonepropionase [Spirosomataceae bacterium TFI 002]|nr:Imidazolonepropionase [Spirosomataceae bacterium TFI 002]